MVNFILFLLNTLHRPLVGGAYWRPPGAKRTMETFFYVSGKEKETNDAIRLRERVFDNLRASARRPRMVFVNR